MLEITIENVRGTTLEIALFGSSADQLAGEQTDWDGVASPVLVAICSAFVKSYRGKLTLMSTKATRVYTNKDIPGMVEMCERW
ncbi:hypothetical protein MKX01_023924 [Papaver californicum]|nr:hypothetical protein MKX01_023924 [Papaver californicum]